MTDNYRLTAEDEKRIGDLILDEIYALRATIEQQAAEIVSLTTQRDALSKPGTPGFYLQGLFELAARYGKNPADSSQHAIAFIREKLEALAKELADLKSHDDAPCIFCDPLRREIADKERQLEDLTKQSARDEQELLCILPAEQPSLCRLFCP